jgi:hypothetical protein
MFMVAPLLLSNERGMDSHTRESLLDRENGISMKTTPEDA